MAFLDYSSDGVGPDAVYQFVAEARTRALVLGAVTTLDRFAHVCSRSEVTPTADRPGWYIGSALFSPRQSWLDQGGRLATLADALRAMREAQGQPFGSMETGVRTAEALSGSLAGLRAASCRTFERAAGGLKSLQDAQTGVLEAAPALASDVAEGVKGGAGFLGSTVRGLGEGLGLTGEAGRALGPVWGLLLVAGAGLLVWHLGPALLGRGRR